jgi:hypothetical protein
MVFSKWGVDSHSQKFNSRTTQPQKAEFDNNNSILIVEIILILIGIFLTFKAYFPTKK